MRREPEAPPNLRASPIPRAGTTARPVEVRPLPVSVDVSPGAVVLAEANVPFLASSFVTEGKIRSGLTERGFLPLRVSETRPGFWPVLSDADWYVLATYIGDHRTAQNIPSAVSRVWQVVA
jgi:hypothetical protein